MKILVIPLLSLFVAAGCSSSRAQKYDAKYLELQKQEAHSMIDQSKEVKIKRGMGDDKIILEDL